MANISPILMKTGRRKEAAARVRLIDGTGNIVINNKPIEAYFKTDTLKTLVIQPFIITKTLGKYDVKASVSGGGVNGQAGAIRLGIARGLLTLDQGLKKILRVNGFLTRDPRAKERKKYGQKRARKKFQYTKR